MTFYLIFYASHMKVMLYKVNDEAISKVAVDSPVALAISS